jgi:hypothetical protein
VGAGLHRWWSWVGKDIRWAGRAWRFDGCRMRVSVVVARVSGDGEGWHESKYGRLRGAPAGGMPIWDGLSWGPRLGRRVGECRQGIARRGEPPGGSCTWLSGHARRLWRADHQPPASLFLCSQQNPAAACEDELRSGPASDSDPDRGGRWPRRAGVRAGAGASRALCLWLTLTSRHKARGALVAAGKRHTRRTTRWPRVHHIPVAAGVSAAPGGGCVCIRVVALWISGGVGIGEWKGGRTS